MSTSPRATDDPTDGRSRSSLFRSKPTDRLQRQDEPVDELTGLPERRTLVAAFEEAVATVAAATRELLGVLPQRRQPPKTVPPLRRPEVIARMAR